MTKNRALYCILVTLFIVVLVVSTVLFFILLHYDQKANYNGELYSIEIVGEYSEEGGPWQPLKLQTKFENWDLRDITVRGHFNRDLPNGAKLFINVDHMRVSLSVNGVELFFLGPVKGDGNPTQAVGKQWVTFISPGISMEDTVELNFGNLYWNAYMIQFDELLWHMHTGDERMMLFEAIRQDIWTLSIGTIFLFVTLFLIFVSFACAVMRIKGACRLLWLGLTTLFSAIWFYTLSPAPTLILPWPVFLNVLYSYSMQGMAIFITLFAADHAYDWRRKSLYVCVALLMALLLIALVNQLMSIQDLYSAINYFSIVDLVIAMWIVFCLGYESIKLKNTESGNLLKSMIPLAICAGAELVNGYIQFCEASVLLGIGLIFFTVMEGSYTLSRIKRSLENEKRAFELENELNHNRIAIMLSQIQPHFLYNSLNSISVLCRKDPMKAEVAIEQFSDFLRGNLDSLNTKELITFSQERKHLELYLSLEKIRFEELLHIEYDFQATDFLLPCLTLQPIAENAVRYGVTKKPGGGTVCISSWETENAWMLCVEDDGVGFDVNETKTDGRSHIGLINVKHRLHAQCDGNISIDSTPENGTVVTITIPKKEET